MSESPVVPDLTVGSALVRVSAAVNDLYEISSQVVGLTPQQARVLFVLSGRPINMLGLGAALKLTKSTMTGVVDRLEAAGLLVREVDPADRRRFIVAPTPHGSAKALQFESDLRLRIVELLATLGETDQKHLAELLVGILARSEPLHAEHAGCPDR